MLKSALRMNAYPMVDMEFIFYNEIYPHLRLIGQQYPTMARLVSRPGENGHFVLVKGGSAELTIEETSGPVTTPSGTDSSSTPPEGTEDLKSQADIEFWNAIKSSTDPELFKEYLNQFPDGIFAVIAKKRLEDLRADEERPHVPKLVGMDIRSAQQILLELGFKRGNVTSQASGRPRGMVLAQRPEPETISTPGAAIDLVIAQPASSIQVPGVVGMSKEGAAETLAKYGLEIGKTRYVSMREAKASRPGLIVRQEPAEGASVEPKSYVHLVISQGDLIIPNLQGLEQSEALNVLQRSGLSLGTVRRVLKGTPGKIISQTPPAGSRAVQGQKVDIYVAAGIAQPLSPTTAPRTLEQRLVVPND